MGRDAVLARGGHVSHAHAAAAASASAIRVASGARAALAALGSVVGRGVARTACTAPAAAATGLTTPTIHRPPFGGRFCVINYKKIFFVL